MENKLELKHLAPYLPYGLRIACGSNGTHNEMVVGPISDLETTSILTVLDKQPFLKPLLIPLSELTEEQWIEVLIAGGLESDLGDQWYQIVWEHGEEYDFEDIFSINISYHPLSETVTYDNKTMSFGGTLFVNQLAAFNKLFELHADVYGLLEAGLALNKLEHGK